MGACKLNRSGLGTVEGLGALTRDELVSEWQRRVRPDGCIIGISGAVGPDAEAAADRLAEQFDSILDGFQGKAPEIDVTPSTTRGQSHHEMDDSAQVQIVMLHDAPAESDPNSWLERVAVTVLSGGMASRLFTEVREKRGLCYHVSASYRSERDDGRVVGYVGTTPERAQQSADALMHELRRLNTPEGAITQEEFDRAMTGLKASIVFSGESTGARAGALVNDQYRLGRPRTLEEITSRLDAVTLDDVNAYLATRDLGPVTMVTLGPAPITTP